MEPMSHDEVMAYGRWQADLSRTAHDERSRLGRRGGGWARGPFGSWSPRRGSMGAPAPLSSRSSARRGAPRRPAACDPDVVAYNAMVAGYCGAR
ncbi:hypothetical protein E2562_029728 [Oryza meyeriana var. granulata]|uniref:Uncharacterized protein n=1 Tax=Oryza meyeriana var. granulata TaxID=110450 RepID=A0A6G1EQZ2_9ORYZ|nr:hypothetical protein E2562_029728 [Oryza meyeriana var. granulata]